MVSPSGDFDLLDYLGDGPVFFVQLTLSPQGCLLVELILFCSDDRYVLFTDFVGVLSNYDTLVTLPPKPKAYV